eukprot:Selendium_serpulae@DN7029_c0_g1_i1.p2
MTDMQPTGGVVVVAYARSRSVHGIISANIRFGCELNLVVYQMANMSENNYEEKHLSRPDTSKFMFSSYSSPCMKNVVASASRSVMYNSRACAPAIVRVRHGVSQNSAVRCAAELTLTIPLQNGNSVLYSQTNDTIFVQQSGFLFGIPFETPSLSNDFTEWYELWAVW